MEDLFGINAHRQAVQENIAKAFDLGFDADSNIEGIEKAKHQVGDIHPNGRWVWTEWAPGKFDWKSLKGKHHKGSQQTTTKSTSNEESKKDKVKQENISTKLKDLKKKIKDVYGDESEPTITDKNTILIKRPYGTIMEHYKASNKLGVAVKADFVLSNKHANYSLYEISLDNSEKMKEYEKEADNDKKLKNRFSYLSSKNDASEEDKKEDKEESKSSKLSAFVDKTLKDIKDYAYGNFDDDRLKKAEKVLTENESLAKKFMSATFPAASESALSPSEKEISISDDESIILSAYKATDTTSRDPQYRGSTNYYYSVHYKVGNSKKLLSSDSYSRVFSSKYGGTSSERRQKCKIEALIRYFHI